jgi:hypothetical protein
MAKATSAQAGVPLDTSLENYEMEKAREHLRRLTCRLKSVALGSLVIFKIVI